MLERDAHNIRSTPGRFAPELLATEYAREAWALFEQGALLADSKLTESFVREETPTDPDGVLFAVEDARQDTLQRKLGRENSMAAKRFSACLPASPASRRAFPPASSEVSFCPVFSDPYLCPWKLLIVSLTNARHTGYPNNSLAKTTHSEIGAARQRLLYNVIG
jgi:hypothetical protein